MNMVAIKVNINGKEMTLDEARAVYMELHKLFGLQQRPIEPPLSHPRDRAPWFTDNPIRYVAGG